MPNQIVSPHGLIENLTPFVINAGANGDNTMVTGVAKYSIILLMYHFMVPDPVTLTMKSSDGTVISGPQPFNTKGGVVYPFVNAGYCMTKSGDGLIWNLSSAVLLGGAGQYGLIRRG